MTRYPICGIMPASFTSTGLRGKYFMFKRNAFEAAELLEARHMLSAVRLGDIRFNHHRTLGFDSASNSYSFTLNRPALLSALTSNKGVDAMLYRDGDAVISGRKLSTVVPAGRYSMQITPGSKGYTAVTLGLAETNVPTRLQADVWGSGGVHLNWDDNAADEAAYRIDRWTHIGWRRSVRVGANTTAAVIDGLSPGTSATYRVSAVTANGVSTRSANIVSATTQPQSTDGWYKVNLSAGTKGEAGWTLAKDTLKVLPDVRDGTNKMKSKWIHASSWQMAVWSTVASWNDNTAQNEAVSIKTNDTDADGNPTYQTHNFPTGGDFKVATGSELSHDPNVANFHLGDNNTKYIVVEDSYGGIDHDYDDFYWKVTTEGIATPELKIASSAFIKQDNVAGAFQHSGYSFEGDHRQGANGSAIFGLGNTAARTRQELTIHPMDVYHDDNGETALGSTTYLPIVGETREYDTASSVVNGTLTAQARADPYLNDGYLKVATGSSPLSGLRATQRVVDQHTLEFYLQVEAPNPLVMGAPPIASDIVVDLDYSDPKHPKYDIQANITSFPCYEITINGTVIMSNDSGSAGPFGLFTNVPINRNGSLPIPDTLP